MLGEMFEASMEADERPAQAAAGQEIAFARFRRLTMKTRPRRSRGVNADDDPVDGRKAIRAPFRRPPIRNGKRHLGPIAGIELDLDVRPGSNL